MGCVGRGVGRLGLSRVECGVVLCVLLVGCLRCVSVVVLSVVAGCGSVVCGCGSVVCGSVVCGRMPPEVLRVDK